MSDKRLNRLNELNKEGSARRATGLCSLDRLVAPSPTKSNQKSKGITKQSQRIKARSGTRGARPSESPEVRPGPTGSDQKSGPVAPSQSKSHLSRPLSHRDGARRTGRRDPSSPSYDET